MTNSQDFICIKVNGTVYARLINDLELIPRDISKDEKINMIKNVYRKVPQEKSSDYFNGSLNFYECDEIINEDLNDTTISMLS